jgi:hypothetical protein
MRRIPAPSVPRELDSVMNNALSVFQRLMVVGLGLGLGLGLFIYIYRRRVEKEEIEEL